MKLSDAQRLEVATFCVSFLFEKFPNERGLFRSSVSQTEVRTLLNQLAQQTVKRRDDYDPHLLAEVLQTTFKDLNVPLMHEVYKDLINFELVDENYNGNKESIQNCLVKLPDNKYAIVNSLFRLLARLASFEDSESSLMQLASSITPTILRPLTSAYMSLRHLEDLKKLRPIVVFLIDNYLDLFTIVRPPLSVKTSLECNSIDFYVPSIDRTASISDMMIDLTTKDPNEESKSRTPDGIILPFTKPNLLVMIPSSSNAMDTSHDSDTDSEKSVERYSDNEWRILMALVSMKVGNFIDLSEKELHQSVTKDASGDMHHSIMQAWAARQAQQQAAAAKAAAEQNNNNLPASSSSSPGSILPSTNNPAVSLTKSHARRSYRRKMVSECKTLRGQIFDFEQEFFKSHNRAPKGPERGPMNAIYVKYRELKREIRDAAARDIQRLIRGARCRKQLHKLQSIPANIREGLSIANYELLLRFKDLIENKKDLKRRLKKFDEDFLIQHGKAPKKSDKEVIRPMYQKYHEIKGSIDSMRKVLIANNIPLPEDNEDGPAATTATAISSSGSIRTTTPSSKSPLPSSLLIHPIDHDFDNESKGGRPLCNFTSATLLDDDGGESSRKGGSMASADGKEDSLAGLLQEKKNLHAYLKVYERDFNRTHGRPVMKNEDILPVANEYQRYKELKTLIKDIKG